MIPEGRVLIDTATLSTLPEREFLAGLAEVVKYGVILDESFFAYLEAQREPLLQRQPEPVPLAPVLPSPVLGGFAASRPAAPSVPSFRHAAEEARGAAEAESLPGVIVPLARSPIHSDAPAHLNQMRPHRPLLSKGHGLQGAGLPGAGGSKHRQSQQPRQCGRSEHAYTTGVRSSSRAFSPRPG